jgi:16S rRNA (guanine1207-N2)-methyltransferase
VTPGAPGHYFSEEPDGASDPTTVSLTLPDLSVSLTSDRGVFSRDRIDAGTKLLLLEGRVPAVSPDRLCDLGCGYGPIAMVLALRFPDATVWAVDVNRRARDLCEQNARHLGLDNVIVAAPDAVDPLLRFDALWSNPPIRVGKPALHALLEDWLDRLEADGSATLVVARNLGADSLARSLTTRGFPVDRRLSRGGYRLLEVGPRP